MVGAPRAPPLYLIFNMREQEPQRTHIKPLNVTRKGGPEIGPGKNRS